MDNVANSNVTNSNDVTESKDATGNNGAIESHNATLAAIRQSGKALMQTPEFQTHVERWGFNFLRTGVLVAKYFSGATHYLCVEEAKAKVNGEYQEVYDVWNLPSGSCKSPTESRQAAGIREVYEETGYHVKLTNFLFIISKADSNFPYSMNVYAARLRDEDEAPDLDHIDHNEIRSTRWLTCAAIDKLAEQRKLRSPHFMLKAVHAYEDGALLPLTVAIDR